MSSNSQINSTRNIHDIDLFEVNEAFAAVVLRFIDELEVDQLLLLRLRQVRLRRCRVLAGPLQQEHGGEEVQSSNAVTNTRNPSTQRIEPCA